MAATAGMSSSGVARDLPSIRQNACAGHKARTDTRPYTRMHRECEPKAWRQKGMLNGVNRQSAASPSPSELSGQIENAGRVQRAFFDLTQRDQPPLEGCIDGSGDQRRIAPADQHCAAHGQI